MESKVNIYGGNNFGKYKMFIPWKSDFGYKSSTIRLEHDYKQRQFYFKQSEKPFFCLLSDSSDARNFLDAVINNSYDDAQIYISRSLRICGGLEEVIKIFDKAKHYKYLYSVSKANKNGEYVNSVLITDNEKKRFSIIHLYMINEPDVFSKWKVYKIEKESFSKKTFKV